MMVQPIVDNPETFFNTYIRLLLQLVTGADAGACHTAWRTHLHHEFMCIGPTGATQLGDDFVLSEWRLALHCGTYGSLWMSELVLNRYEGCATCDATLIRCYPSRRSSNDNISRDLLRLQVIAVHSEDGKLRAARHTYQPTLPKVFRGIQSKSQICQDLWVLHHFAHLTGGGFFLEVGANHPEELSNTYLLEKAAQWNGICVDPFPVGDWSKRSAELVSVAVGPDGGHAKFVAPGHVLGGLVSHIDLPRVMRDVPKDQQQFVEVETRTLSTILKSPRVPRVIHYLSLDTEGSELDILLGFPFDQCTLLSATVEHNYREPCRTQIRELLERRGFVLDVSVEHDDFFLLMGYEQYLSVDAVSPNKN